MPVFFDRVQDTTTTTGTTSPISLANSPPTGYQAFSVVGNGNQTYYAITSGSAWEVGIGTYTSSGTTLSRSTVYASSNSGSLITLAGTSTVFLPDPAHFLNSLPTGSGTTNNLAVWTGTGTLGTSLITDNGTSLSIQGGSTSGTIGIGSTQNLSSATGITIGAGAAANTVVGTSVVIGAWDGGSGSGATPAGAGGNLTLQAGAGKSGTNTGGSTSSAGGSITITAGAGGSGVVNNGGSSGGSITITAGNAGGGGTLNTTPSAGNITITSGSSASNGGGNISIQCGEFNTGGSNINIGTTSETVNVITIGNNNFDQCTLTLAASGTYIPWNFLSLASTLSVSNTTFTTTNFSWFVSSGNTYQFDGVLSTENTTAADGVKFNWAGGSAGASNFFTCINLLSGTGTPTVGNTTSMSTSLTIATVATTPNYIGIHGMIACNSTGNIQLQFAGNSSTGTAKLLAGSYITLFQNTPS